jgi:predicted ATPase
MNEQLIVKNFGPIKDATVDFKRVTVFIGPTGGGKSTLAKLAAVFRDVDFYAAQDDPGYLFAYYNLENFFSQKSELRLLRGKYGVKVKGRKITFDSATNRLIKSQAKVATNIFSKYSGKNSGNISKTLKVATSIASLNEDDLSGLQNDVQAYADRLIEETGAELLRVIFSKIFHYTAPAYIPSERIFVSSLNNSWAGLLRDDIGLPPTLLTFANNYSQFRTVVSKLELPIFNANYLHNKGNDFIKIQGTNVPLNLHETASGIQSVTPMLVLLEHLSRNTEQAQSFIIEEPELNLYPTAQQGLLNWLVEKCTQGENDLTITTHSPYILSHLNLLLYAYQVAEKHPERAEEVAELVPRASWINPKEFACYQVENGGVTSLVNAELGLIDDNGLDNLSGDAADAFDNLIRLSKGVARK